MKKLLIRGAIALVLLCALGGAVVLSYRAWGDGPNADRAWRENRYADAARLYDKALAHSFWPSGYRAELLAKRGVAHSWLNEDDAALADLNEALRLDPAIPFAHSARAALYAKRLEWTLALKDVDAAIALLPNFVTLLNQRANIFVSTLDFERAAVAIEAARKVDPQDAKLYYWEAYNLASMGKVDKAVAIIAEAPVTGVNDPDFYAERGRIFAQAGAPDRATQDYEQAIRLAPKKASTYWKRAGSYSAAGKYKLALSDLDHSIELDPKVGRVWYSRGREHYLAGDYRAARDDLKQAGALDPDLPYQMLWLHLTNVRLGEDDHASIAQWLTASKDKDWPRPVVEYFAGQRNEASLRTTAIDKVSPATAVNQSCDTNYYAGALYLAKGQRDKALPLLREAATKCAYGFVEPYAARRDLKSLGE